MAALGVDLADIRQEEPDAALGNGGLGRLAACFMESMASVSLPAYGYGIRYEHGLFRQMISDGWQHEAPEDWLAHGNPWEFERPEVTYRDSSSAASSSRSAARPKAAPLKNIWHPRETVNAVAFDTPIIGWQGRHANTLRLWSARAVDPIELTAFNRGDHIGSFTVARARRERFLACSTLRTRRSPDRHCGCARNISSPRRRCRTSIRRHLSMHKSLDNLADCMRRST